MPMARQAPGMLPVLADVPLQFWAFLGSVAAAFLASRRTLARRDAADERAAA